MALEESEVAKWERTFIVSAHGTGEALQQKGVSPNANGLKYHTSMTQTLVGKICGGSA